MSDGGMRIEEREETNLVQDRRTHKDRTETGLKPVRPILWDRRSRFGLVFRHLVGLCPSLNVCNTVFLLLVLHEGWSIMIDIDHHVIDHAV